MKFLSLAFFLSALALAGCAKDKSKNATPASSPVASLSSNDQCVMMDCQKPKSAGTSSSSATSTATATSTNVNRPVVVSEPIPEAAAPNPPVPSSDPIFLDTQKMAKNVQLTCLNDDCDPSVGLLSVTLKNAGDWNVGQCTASLIGPDVLVTNGHCIPQDLEANGSSCVDRMWINFAADSGHPAYDTQVGCSKILFRRKDGGMDGADYAYIQLARAVNRPVLLQSQAGFENKKTYHLHKINPGRIPEGMAGQMQKVDCVSLYDSAIFAQRLDAQSQTSFFVDCPVTKGNSGSPILDDQGSVRGVIYAFVVKALISKALAKNGSKVPAIEAIADINVGSNFACLSLPGDPDGRNRPASCGDQLERLAQKRAQAQSELAQILKPGVDTLIAAKAAGHPDILSFGWTVTTSTSESLGTLGQGVPDCVKRATVGNFLNKNTKIRRPFVYVRATYDQYLRASNQTAIWAGFSKTAETLHLSKAASATLQMDIADPATGQAEFNAALGYCQ